MKNIIIAIVVIGVLIYAGSFVVKSGNDAPAVKEDQVASPNAPVVTTSMLNEPIKVKVNVTAPSQKGGAPTVTINAGGVTGYVKAVKTGGFTLRRDTGADIYDISTNATTVYQKDGRSATVADVVVGSAVIVVGTVDTKIHTALAQKVIVVTVPSR